LKPKKTTEKKSGTLLIYSLFCSSSPRLKEPKRVQS
jgi:hypothetical protein